MNRTAARLWSAFLVTIAVATGCSSGAAGAGAPPGSEAAPAPPGFPVQVNNCGRTLTIDAPPSRAVTYYQNVLEMMLALGLQDRMVGREGFAESPRLPEQEAAFQPIPELAPGPNPPTREQMLAASPDLVFVAQPSYELDPKRGFATREQLESIGSTVYITEGSCTPDRRASMADVYRDVHNLGMIFGVPDRAEALIGQLRSDIDGVRARVAGADPVSAMMHVAGTGPLTVDGDARGNLLSLAGVRNIFADKLGHTPQVSPEQVIARDPAMFIVVHYRPGPTAAEKRRFLFDTFPTVSATRDRRSVTMENIEIAPGVRSPGAVERIARAAHPDRF